MCGNFAPGCTVFAELLILLPCNNESYLLQIQNNDSLIYSHIRLLMHVHTQMCSIDSRLLILISSHLT